jgi:hypothetical protein
LFSSFSLGYFSLFGLSPTNLATTSSNPPQALINTIYSTHDQGK